MKIIRELFGKTKEGIEVSRYILKNNNDMEVHFTDYGANIIKIIVPDKDGKLDDVVLGYDSIAGYEDNSPGLGSFVGRHANRIKDGVFELNGVTYQLDKNDGNNNLHGGNLKYNQLIYDTKSMEEEDRLSVEFSRLSPHMEQGFPGNLEIKVKYSVTNDNELVIEYHGVSDQDTIINVTNHSYFNLAGHGSNSILEQKLWIDSDQYTEVDSELIPTGEIVDVADTPMDFRKLKKIGQDIQVDYDQLKIGGGYDHNYVLNKKSKGLEKAGMLVDDTTGRVMEIYTDLSGMQLYTTNSVLNKEGKDGVVYGKWSGVCFETQYYPDSINHPDFPSCVLKSGDEFKSTTIYKFSLK